MVARVQVRALTNHEGNKLLRIVRRSSGSVVTWRRTQVVLVSAQGMDVAGIAKVTFTSPDRVRDVLHNFNADASTRCNRSTAVAGRRSSRCRSGSKITKTALARPTDHGGSH